MKISHGVSLPGVKRSSFIDFIFSLPAMSEVMFCCFPPIPPDQFAVNLLFAGVKSLKETAENFKEALGKKKRSPLWYKIDIQLISPHTEASEWSLKNHLLHWAAGKESFHPAPPGGAEPPQTVWSPSASQSITKPSCDTLTQWDTC